MRSRSFGVGDRVAFYVSNARLIGVVVDRMSSGVLVLQHVRPDGTSVIYRRNPVFVEAVED